MSDIYFNLPEECQKYLQNNTVCCRLPDEISTHKHVVKNGDRCYIF